MSESTNCKIVDGKCVSGADIGHFVGCYSCGLNPKKRTVNVPISFPDYQFIKDACKVDDFNMNEAMERIFKVGIERLKMTAI